ncbi:MAG: transposase [Candidatus Riflebacteria bacterium]
MFYNARWYNPSLGRMAQADSIVPGGVQVKATSFKSLKSFVNTLRNWWRQILNYFDGRFNNGFAEGVNLKIKCSTDAGMATAISIPSDYMFWSLLTLFPVKNGRAKKMKSYYDSG